MYKSQKVQGDVMVNELNETIEADFSPLPKEGKVIALGETSGHRHVLVANPESEVLFAEKDGKMYMNILSGTATLGHWIGETRTKADHEPITLTTGFYFITRQREYDELGDRQVVD